MRAAVDHLPLRGSARERAPAVTEQKYDTAVWEGDFHSPLLRPAWAALIRSRDTLAASHQSPIFLDYLREAEQECRFDVLTFSDREKAIVGVVPIKKSALLLPFSLAVRKLTGSPLKCLSIIGSEPLLVDDPAAFENLFLALSRHYPDADVIYMGEVPRDSRLWRHISTSAAIRGSYDIHVLDGFRECHSIRLPHSIEEHRSKLGKKKRYNLVRQERVLETAVGPLELVAIDGPSGLAELYRALDSLVPTHQKSAICKAQYEASSKHGFLKCYVLKSANRPIALALGSKAGATYRIHRFHHDKSLEKYSPGTTLWQLVLKDLIVKSEFTSVDMGYGAPAHRSRATNTIEYRGRILLFRRSFRNHCRILALSGRSAACRFVKRQIARYAGSGRVRRIAAAELPEGRPRWRGAGMEAPTTARRKE